jgi:RNA polymerase-binding transcription factor DksA
MSTNLQVKHDNDISHSSGVWYRLHAEREEICDVLLKEPVPVHTADAGQTNAIEWHRELLQARLRKIDDALDRLMSGSYGNCSKCGRWIEDTKLDFDPAIAYCIECWPRIQTVH